MKLGRQDMIFRGGLLATRHRERVSTVPLRYRQYWAVSRVVVLAEHQIDLYDTHCVIVDDDGKRVIYTRTESIGAELNKRQVNSLLGL